MSKGKKELMASAPWRVEEDDGGDKFSDAKMKVTRQQAGAESTMHVPGKKTKRAAHAYDADDSLTEIDPELRYSFHRNYQVPSPVVLNFFTNSLYLGFNLLSSSRNFEERRKFS